MRSSREAVGLLARLRALAAGTRAASSASSPISRAAAPLAELGGLEAGGPLGLARRPARLHSQGARLRGSRWTQVRGQL